MKIGAFITTLPHPQKQEWLVQSVASIEAQHIQFDKKLITIDQGDHTPMRKEILNLLNNFGWEINFVNYCSRPKTFKNELVKFLDCDWLLYGEDDIIVDWFPKQNELIDFLRAKDISTLRECGILTPSIGGSTFHAANGCLGDFEDIDSMVMIERDDLLVLRRPESHGSEFFFELGTLFLRPHLFLRCVCHAEYTYPGMLIEQALTRSWFDLGMHNHYYKATFCNPNIRTVCRENILEVDNKCKFITPIDPNQGNCSFSGNHVI